MRVRALSTVLKLIVLFWSACLKMLRDVCGNHHDWLYSWNQYDTLFVKKSCDIFDTPCIFSEILILPSSLPSLIHLSSLSILNCSLLLFICCFFSHLFSLLSQYFFPIPIYENRIIPHPSTGCNRKILLQLYKSLIRSRLDYGAYGQTPSSLPPTDLDL